jgi:hypothetical protein
VAPLATLSGLGIVRYQPTRSPPGKVRLTFPRLGQELLLPSQSCTLVESKRGGYAASHLDAMTLAVTSKFTLLLLLWEQPLGARKP